VLTVEFTVMGIPCLGLNGGPAFKHNEAFSFQVATADQSETDRYWDAIVGNGGEESACGWCKDKASAPAEPGRSSFSLPYTCAVVGASPATVVRRMSRGWLSS
jgi:3-demethylubiquinone-9 3-methyltransferase